jgi:REP element-mobilizing transposase RayT
MPNHMHALLRFERTQVNAGIQPFSLGETIQWFKTMSTNEYIRRVNSEGWPRFTKRLWQRDYYEHIIRNDGELLHARGYILRNPEKWSLDRENAAHVGIDPDEPELLFASEEE